MTRRIKTVIHPDYAQLGAFVRRLPDFFGDEGSVIYHDRNEIRVFDTEYGKIAVKSFRIPFFFNRIAYTFARPSKASRSYRHSLILQDMGIGVPAPVACVEEFESGLLRRSYYVSRFLGYPDTMRKTGFHKLDETRDLAVAFGRFTARLHDCGVLHGDYSPGNILFKEEDGEFRFALIDVNRMTFGLSGGIGWKAGCRNLRRLWGSDETVARIAGEYAAARGFDPDKIIDETLRQHGRFWRRYARRHSGSSPVHYK